MKKLILSIILLLLIASAGVCMASEKDSCIGNPGNSCAGYPNASKIKAKSIVFEVDTVELSEDGKYVSVFSSKHDLIATIDSAACKNYKEIKQGSKLRLWYKFMTMSLPARTNASRAKIIK